LYIVCPQSLFPAMPVAPVDCLQPPRKVTQRRLSGWRRALLGALLGALPGLPGAGGAGAWELPRIQVVLSEEGDAYESMVLSLQARLHEVLDDDFLLLASALPAWIAATDVMVGIGGQACIALRNHQPLIPLLCVWVPRRLFDAAGRTAGLAPSLLYLDQPVDRQVALAQLVRPQARRIGFVYSRDSRPMRDDFERALAMRQLALRAVEVTADNNIVQSLMPVLEQVDLLLATPDPVVFNPHNIQPLFLTTYAKGVPVITSSEALLKAGALAAVYSTPEQIGRQTAEMIAGFFASGGTRLPASQYPRYFSVGVNRQVATTLGFPVPDPQRLQSQLQDREGPSPP
ncbi:MAG: hypothetical protein M3Z21_14790, partial [Pseudomonadota bacterium]|nr:hypothetical protein [Pseudomonadota bacterium]